MWYLPIADSGACLILELEFDSVLILDEHKYYTFDSSSVFLVLVMWNVDL